MKRSVIILLLCLTATICAGEKPPDVLLHSAQCLAAKNFLPSAKTSLTLGYFIDPVSYPDSNAVYVVNYATSARSNGTVFTVFFSSGRGRLQTFDIQNNTDFVLSKNAPNGVDFVSAPLGGEWTQAHLVSAIRQIEGRRRFTFSSKDLSPVGSSIRCESYADPNRKSR